MGHPYVSILFFNCNFLFFFLFFNFFFTFFFLMFKSRVQSPESRVQSRVQSRFYTMPSKGGVTKKRQSHKNVAAPSRPCKKHDDMVRERGKQTRLQLRQPMPEPQLQARSHLRERKEIVLKFVYLCTTRTIKDA